MLIRDPHASPDGTAATNAAIAAARARVATSPNPNGRVLGPYTRLPLNAGDPASADGVLIAVSELGPDTIAFIAQGKSSMSTIINADSVTLPIGTPVALIGGADRVQRAQGSNQTLAAVLGLVSDLALLPTLPGKAVISGVLTATPAQWDAVVPGQSGGLTPDAIYYLDPLNPGSMTLTPPSTPGQFLVQLGQALSPVDFNIRIQPSILL
jgi:hypothetical protein